MSKPITCFLVDDEPLARLRMTQLLTSFPEIKIVGEFGSMLCLPLSSMLAIIC